MTLEDRYVTATPEGVSLDTVLAGLGSRFAAFALDFIIQVAFLVIVFLVINAIARGGGETSTLGVGSVSTRPTIALGGSWYPRLVCARTGRSAEGISSTVAKTTRNRGSVPRLLMVFAPAFRNYSMGGMASAADLNRCPRVPV